MADNTTDDAGASPGTVQRVLREGLRFGDASTPPSSSRDTKDVEVFAASVITDPNANVMGASGTEHVVAGTVEISRKRNRAVAKWGEKGSKKTSAATNPEGETSKKGGKVSQTLEGFQKVTATSAVALGHLRHLCDYYHIETGVKTRIPLAGETIDKPMVDPTAPKGEPIEGGYTPVFWEFFNYELRLPASEFINNVLAAIDRAPAQLELFAWATLTAFQVGCLSVGVIPTLNLFNRILHLQAKNLLYHGKPWKASPSRWHKYTFFGEGCLLGRRSSYLLNRPRHDVRPTLALDIFCDPDVLIKAGLSKSFDNFPQFDLGGYIRESVHQSNVGLIACNCFSPSVPTATISAYNPWFLKQVLRLYSRRPHRPIRLLLSQRYKLFFPVPLQYIKPLLPLRFPIGFPPGMSMRGPQDPRGVSPRG
ncbi:hypothetical protein LIER_13216 [Lithospermum erythrorhizon]|uniref:Uncharacterized protein n=1 Tax=Lithospermum erythrorhizon TaxID=34254 RepID=A0AAV3PWU9_LITER